jgi:hypothetical protein
MKKILFCLASAFLTSMVSYAEKHSNEKLFSQNNSGAKCYDENSRLINLGIGFGGADYYKKKGVGYSYIKTPAFSFSYEQAFSKKIGPGYLGIGAYAGFMSARANYVEDYYFGQYYYEHHWNYFMVAARAAYHPDFLCSEKAEVYGGAIVGMRFQTHTINTNNPDPDARKRLDEGFVYPSVSLLIGARWYFVPKVALFAEAGWGISYGTAGVTFKL